MWQPFPSSFAYDFYAELSNPFYSRRHSLDEAIYGL